MNSDVTKYFCDIKANNCSNRNVDIINYTNHRFWNIIHCPFYGRGPGKIHAIGVV